MARRIQPKAILFALGLFAILFSGTYLLAKPIVRSHVPTQLALLNAFTYLTWIICGFVSGAFARRSGTIHGLLFGLFSTGVVALLYVAFTRVKPLDPLLKIEWFLGTIVLGGLGGFSWDLYNWVRSKTSNKALKRDAAKCRRVP